MKNIDDLIQLETITYRKNWITHDLYNRPIRPVASIRITNADNEITLEKSQIELIHKMVNNMRTP